MQIESFRQTAAARKVVTHRQTDTHTHTHTHTELPNIVTTRTLFRQSENIARDRQMKVMVI